MHGEFFEADSLEPRSSNKLDCKQSQVTGKSKSQNPGSKLQASKSRYPNQYLTDLIRKQVYKPEDLKNKTRLAGKLVLKYINDNKYYHRNRNRSVTANSGVQAFSKIKTDYSVEEINKIAALMMQFIVNLKLKIKQKKLSQKSYKPEDLCAYVPQDYEEYIFKNKQKVNSAFKKFADLDLNQSVEYAKAINRLVENNDIHNINLQHIKNLQLSSQQPVGAASPDQWGRQKKVDSASHNNSQLATVSNKSLYNTRRGNMDSMADQTKNTDLNASQREIPRARQTSYLHYNTPSHALKALAPDQGPPSSFHPYFGDHQANQQIARTAKQ